MGISNVLGLVCGLALFLYGMEVMSDSLKRSAGNQLKTILGKMTSNRFKGFLLGLAVTAVIQSSSATTVMVVGFVNSGTMTLLQAVGVIMGANVGTSVTSWLTALSGLGSSAAQLTGVLEILKPDSWMPILALIGIILIMFSKRGRKKDIGAILLGFSILMVGMGMMSDSVSVLKENEAFKQMLTMFENPILGVLVGMIMTAIIQSSSASVGILQALAVTGAISFGAAIPIIMGQNIGTCITAILSSFGANTNGKRTAFVHLYFNVIGTVVCLALYYLVSAFVTLPFATGPIDAWGIAIVHTIFNIVTVIFLLPFTKILEKLAVMTVKDKGKDEHVNLLDDRLLATPSLALDAADRVTHAMAQISCKAMKLALEQLSEYDAKKADLIREYEDKADIYEDTLGTYLVKISAEDVTPEQSRQITMLLHLIGDFERISDHAVNILESAEEIKDKKIKFSCGAQKETKTITAALTEIIALADEAYENGDLKTAVLVEPLEQVVDSLKDRIKLNHVMRLQRNECTIEHGFVLSDLLNNFERVSDHCSNIAGCLLEISNHNALDMHKYLSEIKKGSPEFDKMFNEYHKKYAL